MRVSVLNNLLGNSDVILEGMMRTIDHDRSESAVDASLADLKISAVVKVKSKINARILDSSLSKRHQILLLSVLSRAGGNLKNNRRLSLSGSLSDRLNDLHIIDVESADSISASVSLLEHLSSSYKCHCK